MKKIVTYIIALLSVVILLTGSLVAWLLSGVNMQGDAAMGVAPLLFAIIVLSFSNFLITSILFFKKIIPSKYVWGISFLAFVIPLIIIFIN